MSSLKMTFSLASLVILIAFGLVFGTSSVMAHEDATNAVDTPRVHTHPLREALPAQTNADGTTPGTEVAAHYSHPTVASVALKAGDTVTADGTSAVITADDTTTTDVAENELTLVVTFSEPVNTTDGSSLTVTAADLIDSGDFTLQVRNANNAIVTTGTPVAVSTGTAPIARVTNNEMAFEVRFAFTTDATPNGTEDDALEYLTFYVQVNAGAAFGLARPAGINPDTPGGASYAQPDPASSFRLIHEIPTPPDTTAPAMRITTPTMAAANGDVVFTIDFDKALGTGPSGLQATDFTITGGTGVLAEVDPLPTGDDAPADMGTTANPKPVVERYTLTVTPDAMGDDSVTITLGPDAVADALGNVIVPGASTTATYDITPPTVVITPPAAPDDGKLLFTFMFSEPIQGFPVGAIDRSGSDNVRLLDGGPMLSDDSDPMMPTYTLLVTPADATVDTTVLILIGSVMDMAGNGLAADVQATYEVPVTNTPPVFEAWENPGLTWCRNDDRGALAVLLPTARDTEGDTLTYSLLSGGSITTEIPDNPSPVPTEGLYWVTVDSERRYLRGTATLEDAGTYTWSVMDEHDAVVAMPITLTIVVDDYDEPNPITRVSAEKVAGEAIVGDDVDRVRLTWTDSNPTMYPNNADGTGCIPAVTHYIISRQALTSHSQGRMADGDPVIIAVTLDAGGNHVLNAATLTTAGGLTLGNEVDGTFTISNGNRVYTTDQLDHGTYVFTVIARNLGGNSMNNEPFDWDVTDHHWVIVNDPPVASTNLRANQTDEAKHSVTLDWIPPTHNPDAPVNDAADAMALYGVNTVFGRYHIEVTDQSTGNITIYPKKADDAPATAPDPVIAGDERTFHIDDLKIGEYTARVVAHNVVGEGALSNSQDFEIDVYKVPDETPNNPPVFADGAKIDNIVATRGEAISGVLLPVATDVDADDELVYAMDPLPPAGLTFDDTNLTLTGAPLATTPLGETIHVYSVSDGEDTVTLRFFITVKTATAGPPPTSRPGTSLPAKGFIVYVRDINNTPHFGTSSPLVAEWSAMPNLHELFTQGGGGSLQLTANKADGTNVGARQVVFSEVMWAVDLGKVGQASYTGNQWIELHNRTDTAIPISDISFAVKADGRPALEQSTDLISNVVGGGDNWIKDGKGQNGASGAADGSGQIPFKSMFRTRYHNDSAGWSAGEWKTADQVYHPNHYGTPGEAEPKAPVVIGASGVRLDTVFNEIGNYPSGNSSHEWIELRHVKGDKPNFENWVVDIVTGVDQQTRLFTIPKLDTGRYDDILLITKTDPARDDNHPLRGGYNVRVDFAQQDNEGRDKNIRYYVASDWTTDLPDNGEFVLIFRHGNDKTNHEKVEDIAGYHPDLKVDTADLFTNLWPLRGYAAPNIALNKIDANKVHRRQKDNIPGTKTADKADNADHVALRDVGWTGIGYKRNANAGDQNGGTPGYPNNAMLSNETQAGADPVIISEIMYATGDRGNIPQWIELRNLSQTSGVNLDGWQITIVNHDQDNAAGDTFAGDLVKSYALNGKIPPGQTFLVVAHSGTDDTNLPSERIHAVRKRRGELILSQYGFEITVEAKEKDGKRAVADMSSNLGTPPAGNRVRGNAQSYVDPAWMLPAGMNIDGDRVSIVRVFDGAVPVDGDSKYAWKSFDMSSHVNAPESTYYGNRNDLSSPGYTANGVLPVSLSKFRPERMKDTGEIVVRWITESETNNAGFNILRGEALDGEFTKVHFVAGKGTTTERNVYEWTDKSAKPNVVYYYQIQDISLDGEVTTLRTTHLRGNVTVVGKLTTTWGKLKALR